MAGRKVFQPATVLTAADVNDFLMDQSVMVFADSAARGSAIPAPTQGMVAYLQDTSSLQVYGTAWGDVSNPGDITAVTAGTGLTGGGVSGDVTLNVDLSAITPITTQGDLVIGDAAGAATRIGIGAVDTVLKSNGTTATWEVAGGGALSFVVEVGDVLFVDYPLDVTKTYGYLYYGGTVTVDVLNSSDALIETLDVSTSIQYLLTHPAGADKLVFTNTDTEDGVIQFVEIVPSATTPVDFILIDSTQSVTLTKTYNAYLIGGGGGGGNVTNNRAAGAGGGGSGYFTTGTVTAGTYTATIGAGGAAATAGGATSIDVLTANGGSPGTNVTINFQAGNGGNGGSGGGGGGAENNYLPIIANGGADGASGSGGTGGGGGGVPGTGGTGSGTALPANFFSGLLGFGPAATASTAVAGFYRAGNGGSMEVTPGASNATGYGGGGQGASTTEIVSPNTASVTGGTGFQGLILLIGA